LQTDYSATGISSYWGFLAADRFERFSASSSALAAASYTWDLLFLSAFVAAGNCGFAGLAPALLQEAGLGRADQRLTALIDGYATASRGSSNS